MLPSQPAPALHGRSQRLVLSFALRVAIVLAVAAAGILWFVRSDASDRAERAVGFHARFVANTIIRDRLVSEHRLIRPSRSAIDRLIKREVLVEGAVGAAIYDAGGRVSYSSSRERRSSPDKVVEQALRGRTSTTVVNLRGSGKTLVAVAPLRDAAGRVVGAFELDQDYGPVAASARSAFLPVAGALSFALLVLYASLFPILRRLTSRLRRQVGEIEFQALHDALTGLPNRRLFQERVEHGARIERRRHSGLAVLLIDLDRFKEINDALGHASGDTLLVEVARRFRSAIRESDTIARLGGDEFAVLALGVTDDSDARATAQRLHEALLPPVVISGISLDVTCSIGVARADLESDDVTELLRRADIAMYASKQLLERTVVYSPGEDTHTPERLSLVSDLARAVERDELELVYQPKLDVGSGDLQGVEALMRWRHGGRGPIPPGEFIPLAEHTGLIRPLTSWALGEAIRQASDWRRQRLEIAVAVNLSARDVIDLALPREIGGLLEQHELPPGLLELEITETAILADPARARSVLAELSRLGVRLAIDDFGSGYTSLGYLRRLPVDALKIDNSFVRGIGVNPQDEAIVRSTIALAHNLGLEVVAEGVESQSTLAFLRDLGCDIAQGYFLGRPAAPGTIGLSAHADRVCGLHDSELPAA